MDRILLVLLSGALAGSYACSPSNEGSDAEEDADADADADGDADSDADSDSDTNPEGPCNADYDALEPPQVVLLNEIVFSSSDYAEIKNFGTVDQPLTGFVLATGPSRVYQFAADLVVPGLDTVLLSWAVVEACEIDDEACAVGAFANDLTAGHGELALFRANDVDCAAALVDYVRWGAEEAAEESLEALAVEAGQWPEGESVDLTTYVGDQGLAYDGSQENGAAHWFIDPTHTLDGENFECDTVADCWSDWVCTKDLCVPPA